MTSDKVCVWMSDELNEGQQIYWVFMWVIIVSIPTLPYIIILPTIEAVVIGFNISSYTEIGYFFLGKFPCGNVAQSKLMQYFIIE